MKKFLFLLLAGTFMCSSVFARHNCSSYDKNKISKKGGFVDTTIKPMSIEEVNKMSDNEYVVLQGYITKKLGNEKYNFSDGNNNIVIEIDDKNWNGQTVTPKDKVTIYGELDKNFTDTGIDVKSLKVIE